MYKKLLSFKRNADKTHIVNALEESNSQRAVVAPAESSSCTTCCTACCCCCCNCCESREDRSRLCQLCTASLVLPSCVGAIRALQCNILQQTAAATTQRQHRQQPVKHSCCQTGSNWLPASESLARHRLQVVAKTRCCC